MTVINRVKRGHYVFSIPVLLNGYFTSTVFNPVHICNSRFFTAINLNDLTVKIGIKKGFSGKSFKGTFQRKWMPRVFKSMDNQSPFTSCCALNCACLQ